MKALVKKEAAPGIWFEDVETPTFADDQVLIKVHKTAICGTDMHIYHWDKWAQKTIPTPMTVGHEFSGVIEKVGVHVKGLSVGMRVSGEGHITCGQCRNCRIEQQHLCPNTIGLGVNTTGAFAEYVVLPASNVFPLPDDVSDEVGAILDPYGNAAHTVLSFDLVGEDVLITGAGPIGIMASWIAKKAGARHVVLTDVNPYRLGLAEKLKVGVHTVDVSKQSLESVMATLGMDHGFSVGYEMSGHPQAFHDMLEAVDSGAKIGLLGLLPKQSVIDWDKVIFKGLVLKGIYGREMYRTWYKMTALLQSGLDISSVITHRFPVEEYQSAFEVMDSGQSGKVILDWGA